VFETADKKKRQKTNNHNETTKHKTPKMKKHKTKTIKKPETPKTSKQNDEDEKITKK
jgi:hypothetical protein